MKDPLYGNKVAAAVLVVLLLAVGLPVVVGTFAEIARHAGHHDEESPYPGGFVYAPFDPASPAFVGTGGGDGGDDGAPYDLGALLASADVERGARSAAICSSCHSFDRGGVNGTGPNLWEIVNRPVASVSGYAYSGALQSFGGVWSYDRLDPYLENSQGYINGTQMAQKIRKDQKRADILAYLGSLSDSPAPYPEPLPPEEAEVDPEVADSVGAGEAPGADPAQAEVGEAAADTIDFEAAQPGEAVVSDQTDVNNRGNDGMPGDAGRSGSDYRSSDEDGAEDTDPNFTPGDRALPSQEAVEESRQPEASGDPRLGGPAPEGAGGGEDVDRRTER